MLVEDVDSQVLQIIVMDADLVSSQDKVIGVAQIPLKTAACTAMPRTRVPLSLNINKLMAPQQGLGGILELPIRVAGLPLTAAATGGRLIYQNIAGALGVAGKGSGSKGGSKDDRYDEVLDETGWLGPSEEYWEERGEYGRDAAAKGMADDEGEGSSSSSSNADGGAAAAVDASTAVLVPSSDPAVAAARAAASSSSSSSSSPFDQGQVLKVTVPAGSAAAAAAARHSSSSSSSSSRPVHARRLSDDDAPRSDKAGAGLSRLASQSAPLTGFPEPSPAGNAAGNAPGNAGGRQDPAAGVSAGHAELAAAAEPHHTPEVRGPPPGPGKPAIGTQQQEQQQQQQQQKEKEAKDQEQKEVLQSMQGTVAGRDAKDLGGTQIKPIRRGTAFLELTYTPFRRPEVQPSGAGASPAASLLAIGLGRPKPTDLGILAVTVVRARGLTGWQHEADPYVILTLMETAEEASSSSSSSGGGSSTTAGASARLSTLEEQRSKTVYNEESPRFNEKFDFIMVPASSVLLVTVWDQTTVVEAVVSLSLSRERFRDQVLGRVKVPVMDVAAAGRVRSSWPLQGAMMGELEMILQWIPQHLVE
uniref:C2 domain-containing protein n=1 Tax=Tetradesmus obliquus TaxID=3088 RepID=A0A383W4N2_TETOB|eukprot:jgi/Sobl393_1/11981/SZX71975.1